MIVWYDVILLTTFAWTGLMLGFISLYLMQSVVRRAAGRTAGWLLVLAVLPLASFGIYVGRVLRWNSWDVLTDPGLLSQLGTVAADRRAIAMTILLCGFLTLSYLAIYVFMRLEIVEEPSSR